MTHGQAIPPATSRKEIRDSSRRRASFGQSSPDRMTPTGRRRRKHHAVCFQSPSKPSKSTPSTIRKASVDRFAPKQPKRRNNEAIRAGDLGFCRRRLDFWAKKSIMYMHDTLKPGRRPQKGAAPAGHIGMRHTQTAFQAITGRFRANWPLQHRTGAGARRRSGGSSTQLLESGPPRGSTRDETGTQPSSKPTQRAAIDL